jgi:eukaryotic-like serine/threonine-protein kinase
MSSTTEGAERILAAALSMPESERTVFLARVCDDSRSRCAQLHNLLRAVDRARAVRFRSVGDQVDDYQLLEEIGKGGCAEVYRAEQLTPIRREVALKIVRVGMNSRSVLARFGAERQVLALMDHPNIAKVLDAGATASGRPYFVMELVRGITITEYCNQVRLGLRERVILFIQVCHAIQHAHHKGVVHRDIKPSNVLITLVDGACVAKVIDFGIAKAMQGWLTEEILLTATEQFVGTPAYVSPEQTELGGSMVDTRSDIYSLGVLLYELLTGRLPFDLDDAGFGNTRIRERIRSEEPPSPSRRLECLPVESLMYASQVCRTSASGLVREVKGDLDWIVLRCLEKQREHRYQAVNDLLADLSRYLRDEPIARAPRRAFYRMRKFARRHRIACRIAATVVVSVMAAGAIMVFTEDGLVRANQTAQEFNDFLRFAVVAHSATPGPLPQLERKDIFASMPFQWEIPSEQGRAYLPLTQASVHLSLASTYRSLGDGTNERLQLEEALEIYRQERGDRRLFERLGTSSTSTLRRPEVTSLRATPVGGQPLKQAALATALAFVHYRLGQFNEARELLEGELAIGGNRRDARGNIQQLTVEVMAILAAIYAVEGDPARAETFAQTVADTRQRTLGAKHWDTLKAKYLLSEVHASAGKLALAADELLAATDFDNKGVGSRATIVRCRVQPSPGLDTVRPLLAEQTLVEPDFDVINAVPGSPTSCTYSK